MDFMNGAVISDITGNDQTIGNTRGNFKIMMLYENISQTADPYKSEKPCVFYLVRIKFISHQNIVPSVRSIVILDQAFDFIGTEIPPSRFRFNGLNISKIVFIFS